MIVKFKKGEMPQSGQCAHCGAEYKVTYDIKEREVFHRDYDGRPSDFTLDDIIHNTYATMCEKCGNISIGSFDELREDDYNLTPVVETKEYQSILHSNEPLAIKQLKLLVLKYKGSNFEELLLQTTLYLAWYYDFINDEELFEHYARLFIHILEIKKTSGLFFPLCKEIRLKAKGTFKPTGKKVNEIPLFAFDLKGSHILADLYRRLGEFDKAIEKMKEYEDKITAPVDERANIDVFIAFFYKACEEKNNNRLAIPPLTHLTF